MSQVGLGVVFKCLYSERRPSVIMAFRLTMRTCHIEVAAENRCARPVAPAPPTPGTSRSDRRNKSDIMHTTGSAECQKQKTRTKT